MTARDWSESVEIDTVYCISISACLSEYSNIYLGLVNLIVIGGLEGGVSFRCHAPVSMLTVLFDRRGIYLRRLRCEVTCGLLPGNQILFEVLLLETSLLG